MHVTKATLGVLCVTIASCIAPASDTAEAIGVVEQAIPAGQWSPTPAKLPGANTFASAPATSSRKDGFLDVAAQGTDDKMYNLEYTVATGWGTWTLIDNRLFPHGKRPALLGTIGSNGPLTLFAANLGGSIQTSLLHVAGQPYSSGATVVPGMSNCSGPPGLAAGASKVFLACVTTARKIAWTTAPIKKEQQGGGGNTGFDGSWAAWTEVGIEPPELLTIPIGAALGAAYVPAGSVRQKAGFSVSLSANGGLYVLNLVPATAVTPATLGGFKLPAVQGATPINAGTAMVQKPGVTAGPHTLDLLATDDATRGPIDLSLNGNGDWLLATNGWTASYLSTTTLNSEPGATYYLQSGTPYIELFSRKSSDNFIYERYYRY